MDADPDAHRDARDRIGGENISEVIEGRERYPIDVRYEREFRDDAELLGRTLIAAPGGAQIPLSHLAAIKSVLAVPF